MRSTPNGRATRPPADPELVRQVLKGGRPGERAGLELLLSEHPERFEDAVALLEAVGFASRRALDALAVAWDTYRRIEPARGAPPR